MELLASLTRTIGRETQTIEISTRATMTSLVNPEEDQTAHRELTLDTRTNESSPIIAAIHLPCSRGTLADSAIQNGSHVCTVLSKTIPARSSVSSVTSTAC